MLVQLRAVLLAPVVLLAQAVLHVQPALALVAHAQVALQALVDQVLVHQVVVQALAVAVVAVLAPQAPLERAALRTRVASPSAPREKSLSRERLPALAVQWCHAAMATPLYASAADLRFRTLQTRLAQTPAS